jgi:hypothetical protein
VEQGDPPVTGDRRVYVYMDATQDGSQDTSQDTVEDASYDDLVEALRD